MPLFPLTEFSTEFTHSMSRESSVVSSEGAAARGSQIHPGAGGIAPASMAPATFGLGTAPLRDAPFLKHMYKGDTFTPVNIPGASNNYYVLSRKTTTDLLAGTTKLVVPGTGQLYEFDPTAGLYRETGLRAHANSDGNWALDNAPAAHDASTAHGISTAPQPGPSHGVASAAAPGAKRNELEQLLSKAKNYDTESMVSFLNKPKKWLFHTFDGEKLPRSKGPDTPTPGHAEQNRISVAGLVMTFLKQRGYKVAMRDDRGTKLHLDVTNPTRTDGAHSDMPQTFSVYVKLSGGGQVKPPADAPMNQPYLLAVVDFNPDDGMLNALHLIPVKHEQQRAVQPQSAEQASPFFRPW
jgi:hypothetical protein